ncbi:hypothetical protein [Lentibacillus amyloliquefaciens]
MELFVTYRKRNGKWEYRIRFQDPITKKQKERSKRGSQQKQRRNMQLK